MYKDKYYFGALLMENLKLRVSNGLILSSMLPKTRTDSIKNNTVVQFDKAGF